MDHDIDDCIPAVEGEAMSEGGVEKVDDALEKCARKGIRLFFCFCEFHSSDDRFVDTQVRAGGGGRCGFAPFFEEAEPFFEGDGAERKLRRVGGTLD